MDILVTGGKGVVGTKLVERLNQKGHDVFVCDLKHSDEDKYFRCDVSNYRLLDKLFGEYKFDYVYHLAAEFGRWNGEDYYESLWISNAIGTKNIIRLQEKYKFKLIFTSSSEVYGDYDGLMSEDIMDKIELKQMNDYAITKWVNEMQIINSSKMYNTETVRVRLFNTYGPGEYYTPYRSVICVMAYRAINDLPYTVYLNHKRTSLYIDDCTKALASIIDNFKSGEVYNISGSELHDIKTVSDMILNNLGKDDSKVNYVDDEKFTTKIKQPDIKKIVRDFNYSSSVNLKEGIPLTIEWMKKVYN